MPSISIFLCTFSLGCIWSIPIEVIFLQQIVYFIIEIFNAALNQICIMTILLQLLHVWMALVSLWLIAQVNLMTVLGEKIPRMFRGKLIPGIVEFVSSCVYYITFSYNSF